MRKGILITLLSALAGGLTAYAVVNFMASDNVVTVESRADGAMFRTVNLMQDDWPDFTYAAESAVDAVVYVKVTSTQTMQQAPSSIFEYFFGFPQGGGAPQQRERVGSGSGVIIREDGYIVTNNHVIDGATKIEVTLNNNQTYPATLVGTDPATDVALLKVEATGLPVIPFGDSDKLRLGEWVIAIGSPYDLRSTITAGIVSAKGRSMPNTGEFKIESFIQTDAAVNPGNSGGALVDRAGNLVGINTAIISQTGSYTGYSFAVPSNIVKKIAYDLMDFGSVKRAILGISMKPIDDKIAEDLKLSSRNGVYINDVSKSSSADKAGMKAGDVLIAIDSVKITTPASVQETVSRFSPGDEAVMTVLRDGKELKLDVVFMGTSQENGTLSDDGSVAFYGSSIKAADEETLAKYGLKNGVEIVELGPGKLMESGAVEGFIIQYVNDHPVKTPQDVIDVVKKSKRTVFIEGVTPSGRTGYFGFGV